MSIQFPCADPRKLCPGEDPGCIRFFERPDVAHLCNRLNTAMKRVIESRVRDDLYSDVRKAVRDLETVHIEFIDALFRPDNSVPMADRRNLAKIIEREVNRVSGHFASYRDIAASATPFTQLANIDGIGRIISEYLPLDRNNPFIQSHPHVFGEKFNELRNDLDPRLSVPSEPVAGRMNSLRLIIAEDGPSGTTPDTIRSLTNTGGGITHWFISAMASAFDAHIVALSDVLMSRHTINTLSVRYYSCNQIQSTTERRLWETIGRPCELQSVFLPVWDGPSDMAATVLRNNPATLQHVGVCFERRVSLNWIHAFIQSMPPGGIGDVRIAAASFTDQPYQDIEDELDRTNFWESIGKFDRIHSLGVSALGVFTPWSWLPKGAVRSNKPLRRLEIAIHSAKIDANATRRIAMLPRADTVVGVIRAVDDAVVGRGTIQALLKLSVRRLRINARSVYETRLISALLSRCMSIVRSSNPSSLPVIEIERSWLTDLDEIVAGIEDQTANDLPHARNVLRSLVAEGRLVISWLKPTHGFRVPDHIP